MCRVKKGDIIINKWAGENNPTKKSIFMGYSGKYGICYSDYKGIHKISYYKSDLENDTEHFVIVGHAPVQELFREMLDKYTIINE